MCLSVAYLFDYDTVIAGAVQAQVLQDGSHLQQSQSVTGARQKRQTEQAEEEKWNTNKNSRAILKGKHIDSLTVK